MMNLKFTGIAPKAQNLSMDMKYIIKAIMM